MSLHREPANLGHNRRERGRVYAVAFDFDVQLLEQLYPNTFCRNASSDVRRFFKENGFENKQGTVYFSHEDISPVECIAAVQDLADLYEWFTPSLKDIRMLRIEENDDLMAILDRKSRRKRN